MRKKCMSLVVCLLMMITVVGIMFGGGVFEKTAIVAQAAVYYTQLDPGFDEEFYIGQKKTLKLEDRVPGEKIKWSIKNKKIATIKAKDNKVTITAKKAGKTYITAKHNGRTYKQSIYVYAPALTEKKITIYTGETVELYCDYVKPGAKVKWSVDKKSIASIKKKSKTVYKITGKKAGTTNVKVKVSGKTLKCKVTVKKGTRPAVISAEQITLKPGESYILEYVGAVEGKTPSWAVGARDIVRLSSPETGGTGNHRYTGNAVKLTINKNATIGKTITVRLVSPENATCKVTIK